jgi:putative protease
MTGVIDNDASELPRGELSNEKLSKKPEILAPAGSFEALRAAVLCGANAVYLGGKAFSARANAANFDISQIREAVDFAHLRSVKIYIAANTLIFDSEREKFAAFCRDCAGAGVDAFIVQDIGGAEIIKKTVKGSVLHASTQMTVTDRGGAEILKKEGFHRVVAARELDRTELKAIVSAGLETEVFVQGALCMSVSGQCLLSALIGGRSANRGDCAQSCRLPFCVGKTFREGENALSLKDLSLISHIKELTEIGVTSLKIEGRMKRPEYVAAAVSAVRAALEGETPDLESLRAVFSRSGFTDSYFTGKRIDMFGKRTKDDVTAAEKILPKLRGLYESEKPTIPLDIRFNAEYGLPLSLEMIAKGESVNIDGNPPEKSINAVATPENIEAQLSKLGGTPFFAENINVNVGEGLFLPKSVINELRREGTLKLSEKIVTAAKPNYGISPYKPQENTAAKNYPKKIIAEIFHKEQIAILQELEKTEIKFVVPIEFLSEISQEYYANIIIKLPKTGKESSKLTNFDVSVFAGLLCQNISHIAIADKYGFNKYGGIHLNVTNSETAGKLADCGFAATVASVECKFREIEKMSGEIGIYAYGKIPAMLLGVCPIRGGGVCPKNCGRELTDRTGRHFTISCRRDGRFCELLNAETLSLEDKTDDIRADFLYLSFYDEIPGEIAEIIHSFVNKNGRKRQNITRGLYRGKRGENRGKDY